MYVRKVRRKCGVRKCKNINCYAISKTVEAGNSVIICSDCLREALKRIDEMEHKNVEDIAVEEAIEAVENEEAKSYVCERCGKKYTTEQSLKRHKCKE